MNAEEKSEIELFNSVDLIVVKLLVAQLVKTFRIFYGARSLIAVFTRAYR
jgi:hypothetical protein